ncbi:MAG: NAD(P)-dependent oxidoreductase [Bacteroidales bacterium]|nr:NAD(P)-dependent oxidoreductase [Bacteroidales bacterium]
MNKIQQEDIRLFAKTFPLAETLSGSRFLITGATGLIGSTLVHCLLALDKGIGITCPVRSIVKAKAIFGEEAEKIQFIECDLIDYLRGLTPDERFQYIVHCASPTAGSYMTEHPVDTFELAVESTRMLLDYARKAKPEGVVYVSSLEYYGQNDNDNVIAEDFQGYVDASSARSSYPMGKRAAEYLCTAYALEHGVPAKIARLTQTFGAGVAPDDKRVFAQFARSVTAGADIVLHTTGKSAKPYCYTTDCIAAILYILLKGQKGEAYNVANDETYITIRDMAEFLRERFNPNIKVLVESHPEMGYAPETKLHLSAKKLKELGWKPRYGLFEMFGRLMASLS